MKRACFLWLSLLALDARAADTYHLDAARTRVSFAVHRFGIPWIDAAFRRFAGDLVIDRRGADSRIAVTILTDSLDGVGNGWNARLRSADWLDTGRYPEMSYRSTRVDFDQADGGVANGDLTLHGVTRPVTFRIAHISCAGGDDGNGDGSERNCAFTAQATIKRSDFGLPHGLFLAGDQVEISVNGNAVRSDSVAHNDSRAGNDNRLASSGGAEQ